MGEQVTGFAPGDRVAWSAAPGSYAELVVVPERELLAVPDGVDDETAAALLLQGLTAHYLVTSTFEYLPGIPVFRSTDLDHVELIGHVAVRDGQLGTPGVPTGGGTWAPTIRHHDGRFWLVVPDMMGTGRGNVLFTADDPAGPWSDGVVMDVFGIDPDIAWDADGTCYVTMSGLGFADDGTAQHLGITQVRLDPETGAALSEPTASASFFLPYTPSTAKPA